MVYFRSFFPSERPFPGACYPEVPEHVFLQTHVLYEPVVWTCCSTHMQPTINQIVVIGRPGMDREGLDREETPTGEKGTIINNYDCKYFFLLNSKMQFKNKWITLFINEDRFQSDKGKFVSPGAFQNNFSSPSPISLSTTLGPWAG